MSRAHVAMSKGDYMIQSKLQKESGFTLLEVIMTITILLTLTIAATSAIRSSINLRQGLAHQMTVSHGINAVMQKVVHDMEGAFIISNQRQEYNPTTRRTKTIFNRERGGIVRLTTTSHQPVNAGSPESDQTFVVYQLQDDKDFPGRKNLLRGESKVIPTNFNEDIPMVILAKGVKTFEVSPWAGSRWSKDNWHSRKREHRNMLPKMVKVHIEMYELDEEGGAETRELDEIPVASATTVVYLPRSWGLKEYKPHHKGELKWL